MADPKKPAVQEEQNAGQQTEVTFSERNIHAAYANFARVTATNALFLSSSISSLVLAR